MLRKLTISACALALALAFLAVPAIAQTYKDSGGTTVPGVVPLAGCTAGGDCIGPASSTTPLPVGVSGGAISIPVPVTVQASAYAAGASEGGLLTIAAARVAGGGGFFDTFALRSKGASTNLVWVYAYQKNPTGTTCTDKTTFVEGVADAPYRIFPPQQITLGNAPGTWDTTTTAALTASPPWSFTNLDTTPTINIYLCIVTSAAVTPASTSDLTATFGGAQN